jgi:FkbM family methyltransferase
VVVSIEVRKTTEIVRVGPGLSARVQLLACRGARVMVKYLLGDRGLRTATIVLGRIFGTSNFAYVRVFQTKVLRISLADGYWIPTVLRGGKYEPEIAFVLDKILRSDSVFIDCGANIGWWSLFASTRIASRERIVAVEASPSTFTRLVRTARLNHDPFTCVNAAIWSTSGEDLRIRARKNRAAAASVNTAMRQPYKIEKTPSLTLDDILGWMNPGQGRVVVKLDVEGAEAEALWGANEYLRRIALLVYEDHGREREAKTTALALKLGLRVFYCDDALKIREVTTPESAQSIKRSPSAGYNFLACWPDSEVFAELTSLET